MKKRVLAVLTTAAMVFTMAACGSKKETASAPAAETKTEAAAETKKEGVKDTSTASEKLTIAVVGKQEASEWWQIFKAGALQAGEDLGINVYYRSPEKETDIEDQVNICRDCITTGIDALILSAADPTALDEVIMECNAASIPVVLVNDTIDDEALTKQKGTYETYVGIVQYNAAALAGEYVAKNYQPCNVAIVEGVPGVQAHTDRMNGFKDPVEKAGFKIVASQTANCDANEAYDVATNMLTANPDIKVFWTTNAEMGLGIVQAIENMGLKAGKDGISVFDFDCSSDDITNIADGKLMGTIDQNQGVMAYNAVEVAAKAIAGEKFDGPGSQFETKAVLVTADNIADYTK